MAGDGSPAGRRSPAVLYGKYVFVIYFSKVIPETETYLGSSESKDASRDSKVMTNLDSKSAFLADPHKK